MENYINRHYHIVCSFEGDEVVKNLIKEGYKECGYDVYVKETEVPAYSSQIERGHIKYLCKEPHGCNYSIHNHQYDISYYEVKREDFERMEVKPILYNVFMPLRLCNFDGFTDVIQKEREGEGWTESYQRDFHTTITKHFFIVD